MSDAEEGDDQTGSGSGSSYDTDSDSGSEENGGWDCAFVDDDDDEDYEVDLSHMNVSSDILAILGAREDAIAAKKAETAGTDWKPPEDTGLGNSEAIADYREVAIEQQLNNEDKLHGASRQAAAQSQALDEVAKAALQRPDVISASIAPLKTTSVEIEDEDYSTEDEDCDSDWDEESVLVTEDNLPDSVAMSANLLTLFGRKDEASRIMRNSVEAVGDWQPPQFSGLGNSGKVLDLSPVCLDATKRLEVHKAEKRPSGDNGAPQGHPDSDGEAEESDRESCYSDSSYDVREVDDDEYLANLLASDTAVFSGNLLALFKDGEDKDKMLQEAKKNLTTSNWQAPRTTGLNNSRPLVRASQIQRLG